MNLFNLKEINSKIKFNRRALTFSCIFLATHNIINEITRVVYTLKLNLNLRLKSRVASVNRKQTYSERLTFGRI